MAECIASGVIFGAGAFIVGNLINNRIKSYRLHQLEWPSYEETHPDRRLTNEEFCQARYTGMTHHNLIAYMRGRDDLMI